MNFAVVDDVLCRASQPNPNELRFLKAEIGLTDIFNISDNSPKI